MTPTPTPTPTPTAPRADHELKFMIGVETRTKPHDRRGRAGAGGTADVGRISVFVAVAMPAMLSFLGVMWDASDYLRALHRADNVAAEAARAAGQAIDLSQAIGDGQIVVDPAAAAVAVDAYAADAGVTAEVAIGDDQQELIVTVTADWEPSVMGMFGFGPRTVTGAATAHLIEQ